MHNRVKGKKARHMATGRDLPLIASRARLFESSHRPPTSPSALSTDSATQSTSPWQILFTFLILSSYMIREVECVTNVKRDRINNQLVNTLPPHAVCTQKNEGISEGMVCQFHGKTHFMKVVPMTIPDADKTNNVRLSTEEFNRRFVHDLIGINVPSTHFYKATNNDDTFYVSSENIEDLQSIDPDKDMDIQLGPEGVAKLAVAATFIADLHLKNIGYNTNGLILIDVDSVNKTPDSIPAYLKRAVYGIRLHAPPLSLRNLRQMIEIYKSMSTKPLPALHNSFHLTRKLYLAMLDIYIKACNDAIDTLNDLPIEVPFEVPAKQTGTPLASIILSNKLVMQYDYHMSLTNESPTPVQPPITRVCTP